MNNVINAAYDSDNKSIRTNPAGLAQSSDSVLTYPRGTNYTNLTASTLVHTGAGKLAGIFVASSSSGTIRVWDNTAGSGSVLVNTFTATAGTLYQFPNVRVATGIYVTTGGTIDCTVFYDPTTT